MMNILNPNAMRVTIVTPYPLKSQTLVKALKRENIESLCFSPKSLPEPWQDQSEALLLPNYMHGELWDELGPQLLAFSRQKPIILFGKMHERLIEKNWNILDRCVFLDESIPLSQIPQLISEIIESSQLKKSLRTRMKVKDFILDRDRRQVSYKGKGQNLRKKEYFLLELLMSNAGQVTTRERIIDFVWNKSSYIAQNTIDVYIHRLRNKLKPLAQQDPIETIPCLGYIFRAT